ncbi:sugar ABC transporter substrate-binding protein [Gleimia sp. 6138-11-ORH1]|uniref:ABC transporter substrate-binding protein n=1 Tax=Gleimia sp. 6138-11-ORH1 TaxID=2973937 RepID=UPI002167789A|nr:sugar ABC transporter substrate-binding protein [Gleimia sp. 6138-11-ORH1]MCS4484900.1 sugar ABC transporter substrate-binding protein [Gleimia sp. 6138-11-ORH1]
MSMKHKTLAAVTTAGILLAACGGTTAPSADSKVIDLWMPPLVADKQDKAYWEEVVKPFEETHGVDVNVTIVPWDSYEAKYLTGVSSGNGPEVGYMYSEMIGDYIDKDQLYALDEFVTDQQKSTFYFLENGKFNNKQYSIPLVVGGARILLYNKDLLEKAGVEAPTNWNEFLEVGKKLKEKEITPLVVPFGDARGVMNGAFFPFIWQAGGELFEVDGSKTRFDSPEVIAAATYLNQLKETGVLDPASTGMTEEITRGLFLDGKVAFSIDTDQNAKSWSDAGINYGVIPSLAGPDGKQGTFIASDSLVMLKQCKDPKLCYELISFMTEGKQMEKFHQKSNFPPIGSDEKNTYPEEFAKIYSEQAQILKPLPVVPNGTGTYQVLYTNLQQMLNGQKTPEQAMKDAATEANQMLK